MKPILLVMILYLVFMPLHSAKAQQTCDADGTCVYAASNVTTTIAPTFSAANPPCKNVTNYNQLAVMVPTLNNTEWSGGDGHLGFIQGTPPNVTISPCNYTAVNMVYSSCSGACYGDAGTENLVSWQCQLTYSPSGAQTYVNPPGSYCGAPAATTTCTSTTACSPQWVAGACDMNVSDANYQLIMSASCVDESNGNTLPDGICAADGSLISPIGQSCCSYLTGSSPADEINYCTALDNPQPSSGGGGGSMGS